MANSRWMNDDDLFNDVKLISEFDVDMKSKPPQQNPNPSQRVRKARAKPSLFEDPLDLEQELTCVPVRGRPVVDYKLLPPGGTPSFLHQQTETSKSIRQVSGMGFSNDLIEHSLRAQPEPDIEPMPHIGLSSSSSASSSASSSPAKLRAKRNSDKYFTPVSSPESQPCNKSAEPIKISPQPLSLKISPRPLSQAAKPPALFDMLKQKHASENAATNTTSVNGVRRTEQKQGFAPYSNFFEQREKPLDINSRRDFPELM